MSINGRGYFRAKSKAHVTKFCWLFLLSNLNIDSVVLFVPPRLCFLLEDRAVQWIMYLERVKIYNFKTTDQGVYLYSAGGNWRIIL